MSEPTNESSTYCLPSSLDVLGAQVAFPFEEQVWAEGFNHLRFVKGDGSINVVKTSENEEHFFQITIPENPTLEQIIEVTRQFIKEAEISVDSYGLSRLLIFCRDLRNSARVLAKMAKSFNDQKQEEALKLINSLYQLAEGLEKSVKGEDISTTSFQSLDDERLNQYELPSSETNLEGYKNNLLLFLLGKNYQSFAEANQQDPKLSQVAEHSTYYSWFKRFIERKKRKLERKIESGQEIKDEDKIPETYDKQIEMFDNYLLANKEKLFSHLFPFIPQSLQEGGRGSTAFWEITTRNIFSFLDQAVIEEGGQKAKEPLKPPLLFTDLGEEVQELLKTIFPQESEKFEFDVNRFNSKDEDTLKLINEIKSNVSQTEYGKMSLFEFAEKLLHKAQEKKQEEGKTLTTYEKITFLWELVQAYEYKITYLLTSAVKEQAFECNLRSYILGRLLQELMGDKVEVYTVNPKGHAFLLVFDKSTNQRYWVDPTARRFYYDKDKRISKYKEPFVRLVNPEEWESIQKQINASPDNFHISDNNLTIYDESEFATILPFRQGIEAGFWNNFGNLKRKKFKDEGDFLSKKEKIKLIEEACYCFKKALEINPNNPDYHYNLAIVYTTRGLAEAMVREKYGIKGEKLTEDQKNEVDRQYLFNLLQAKKHYQKALKINPNNPNYHNNLAVDYTTRGLAEAMVREKYGIKGEELTEDQRNEVDSRYFKNFNYAFWHMNKAYEFDRTSNRLDRFFWVINQIPDNQAQQVFEVLTPQTKQLILQMYQFYQERKPKLKFGSNFENTQFWRLMKQWIDEQNKK